MYLSESRLNNIFAFLLNKSFNSGHFLYVSVFFFLNSPKTLIYTINVCLELPTYLHLCPSSSLFICSHSNFYFKNGYFNTPNVESTWSIIFFCTSDLLSRITILLLDVHIKHFPLVKSVGGKVWQFFFENIFIYFLKT